MPNTVLTLRWGPGDAMLGATAAIAEGATSDAHIADPRAGLPAAIRGQATLLLAIGHAYALWLRDTGTGHTLRDSKTVTLRDAFNEAADSAAVAIRW